MWHELGRSGRRGGALSQRNSGTRHRRYGGLCGRREDGDVRGTGSARPARALASGAALDANAPGADARNDVGGHGKLA